MFIENQEFIGTKEATKILGYVPAYIRGLCAKEEFRKKLGAVKFSGRWILKKEKVKQFAEERKKRKNKI